MFFRVHTLFNQCIFQSFVMYWISIKDEDFFFIHTFYSTNKQNILELGITSKMFVLYMNAYGILR